MSDTRIKAGQFFGVVGQGTDGYFLMSNGDGSMTWEEAGTPSPTITSVSYPGDDLAADPAGGQTVTITGTNFVTGATVTVGGTSASVVSFVSETELTFTTPAKTAGDYDLVVTNTDGGTATSVNGISYNGIPTWTTAAGSLGTFASDTTISTITLQATEPDGGTITFSITDGALPTGLSLSGADIDGTTSIVSADTLYNFTVTAIDDENQSTGRAFSITVEQYIPPGPENFEIVAYTGNGSTQAITGKIGKAASFNGSSSKISFPSPYSHTADNEDLSISGWFKVPTLFTSGYQTILGGDIANSSGNGGTISLLLRYISAGKYRIDFTRLWGTNARYHASYTSGDEFTLTADTWTHFALTYEGSDTNKTHKLYINGSEVYSVTPDTHTTTGNNTNSTLAFGQYRTGIGYFNGSLDQFRFFNKALDQDEVDDLYDEDSYDSSTKSTTDIFDDGSGVALYEFEDDADDTGVGFDGVGQAAHFNGSSSVFDTNVSVPTNWSVSLWLNRTPNGYFGGTTNSQVRSGVYFYANSDGKLVVYNRNSTGGNIDTLNTSTGLVTEGNWHHIAITFDSTSGTGLTTVYVDGTSAGTLDGTPTHSTDFKFGRSGDYATEYFNGRIDDVRIYSDVLTSAEVGYLYNNTTASIPTDNLTAYYKLDGDATDEQGSYDGTTTNVTFGYDGTPTDVDFLGMAFQPDFVWIKRRGATANHRIIDSVRGDDMEIFPNLTNAEVNNTGLNWSFDTNGFSFNTNGASYNASSGTYVAWCWKAGGTVSANNNTNGDITSTVSANQAAGFSIVEYTGNGGTTQSVGHGLSSAPELVLFKRTDAAVNWYVFEKSGASTRRFEGLNTTNASTSDSFFTPSSSTITWTGTTGDFNGNTNEYIMYCFHSVDGYQKVGSYSGGTSAIDVGFAVRWILIKRTDVNADWYILDSTRDTDGRLSLFLYPHLSNAENNSGATYVDISGNTFTPAGGASTSGGTYIYLAIA